MLFAFWLVSFLRSKVKMTSKMQGLTTLLIFFYIGDGKTPLWKCDLNDPSGPNL